MKNRAFTSMSSEEKQRTLMFVLRQKTKNTLTAEEETLLLSELSLETQFNIRVFSSADVYRKTMSFAGVAKSSIVFGASEFWKLKASAEYPKIAIAIITESANDPEGRNQVYIFIPCYRKGGQECVKEKYVSEHLEPVRNDFPCCNLYRSAEASR